MANKTDLPIPLCVDFQCNTTLEAIDLNQVESNADAALSDWHTKVVANSTQKDILVGYIGNFCELQEGYGSPSDKQFEYPLGKNSSKFVDSIDTTTFGTSENPAYIQFKDFAFEANAWETEFNLLMEVYRRQYEEVSNIAGGPVMAVEEWIESNYAETLGGTTSWTMNQLIRVEYHDGTSVLVLVDEANNVIDIPLNVRLCSADNNIYQNAANDLLSLGYTPPTAGTTRTDFIRVMVINMRGCVGGIADDDSYFVTSKATDPHSPKDYAGVHYVKFSMSKTSC